jgi:hypothetical protein
MRIQLPSTLAAALVLLHVSTARASAQTFEFIDRPLGAYDISGCGTGAVAQVPGAAYIDGTVVCVRGQGQLRATLRTGPFDGVYAYNLRFEAPLTATFGAEFPGNSLTFESGVLALDFVGGVCEPPGCLPRAFLLGGPVARGMPSPFLLTADELVRPIPDLGGVTITGGVVNFSYPLLGEPGFGTRVALAFTPVPEPSTAALAALGIAAVAATARRRRQT